MPRCPRPTYDELARYEAGELSYDEAIDLFQRLVDSGLAWQLQGSYGRTAADLIRQGLVENINLR